MQISKSKNIQYIFVDCFDTIILRRCQPDMIFTMWFEAISELYGVSSQSLNKTWKESNWIVKHRRPSIEEPKFTDVVIDFYVRIRSISPSLPAFDEFNETLSTLMLDIEYNNSYINNEIIDFLKEQHQNGKKILCVSDFYLSKQIMEDLFSRLGIRTLFENIYVSSEVGLRKSTGNLYNHVIRELRVLPQSILMVGDNKRSDYKIPQKIGLNSILYKQDKKRTAEKVLYKRLLGIYSRNIAECLPYSNLVFSLYQFCDRLYISARENNVKTIHFFSREGEFLKKMFDRYMTVSNLEPIKTNYLYISRKSSYLPSFQNIEEENFKRLQKQYSALSLSQFAENLCISEEINQSELANKFDMNTVISDFWKSDVFRKFIRTPEFVTIYEKERTNRRKEILDYLKQEGLGDEISSCIVDIGWKGTIQDNLHAITRKPLLGYYFGLNGEIWQSEHNVKKGLMFSTFPYPNEGNNLFGVKYRVYERILYASHGSCLGYKGGTAILEDVDEKEKSLYSFVSKVQENMLLELEDVIKILGNSHTSRVLSEPLIRKIHIRYLLDINKSIINQRPYIDSSQKMNAGDENNVMGMKEKVIVMLKLVRHDRLEFLNKLINQMSYHHLFYPAKLISKISIRRFK